jgi:low temperature requirement protein LtrA
VSTTTESRLPHLTAVLREGERVTPLELFFDLVFVIALAQCTTLIAHEPTWLGVLKGLLVLGVLWWSWVGYAWLTSVVDPEEGSVRLAMFAAMVAFLVCALCVPGAFGSEALLFACAYAAVRPGRERNEIARDSYSYLHLPMVAGIALVAVGIKQTILHVDDPLEAIPAACLLGGAAMYLLAHVAFRLRNMRSLSVRRLVCAAVLLALIPAGASLPALVTLSLLAAALVGMIVYEVVRYADVRDRVRHQLAREPLPEAE